MCIWKLIHTEKLTSILVTVNGNDLMPPVTPEQKLAGDVQNLVRVVGSMAVHATFLISDGSAQLVKQDPKYNAKLIAFGANGELQRRMHQVHVRTYTVP